MKKKLITHTITIKLRTTKGIYTDFIWDHIADLIRKDEKFIKDFQDIVITGENNLDK